MFDKISSGKIYGNTGNQFSAIEIDGDGVLIRNAADETDSSGNLVPAGSDEVLSASRSTGTTINASYIKTGVIDANLMRAGLIQTVPSWNTKWYGAPEDHAAVQMGFTGGSIAATAVSTGSGTVSLTLPGGHGLVTGDYVRVSGLYFTTGALLGGVGLNLPTNGPLDYASATVATNTLTYSKSDITSGLTASTSSTVYVGKAHTITAVVRSFDDPENPAELSTVVVTTSAAHGFSVGEYVELVNVAPTIDGVAYITAVTSTTFTFKQRFGADIELDLAEVDSVLPDLGAPVAIKVLKSYTQNADGSIHITSGTVDSTLIVGEIAATEITIGSGEGVVRVGTNVSPSFQGIWAGSANPSTAEFSVNTSGAMVAQSGYIGGWTIEQDRLVSGSGSTTVALSTNASTPSIYVGSSTPSEAPFRVTNTGGVVADNAELNSLTVGNLKMDGAIQFGEDPNSNIGTIKVYNSTGFEQLEYTATNAGRSGSLATLTVGTHRLVVGSPISVSLFSGPTGYSELNTEPGSKYIITSVTATTISYETGTSGTIASGAATGGISGQIVSEKVEVARWDHNGLVISTNGVTATRRVVISGDEITLTGDDGNAIVALSADGINASAIKSGLMPGGSNLVPNSSFELAPFAASRTASAATNITGGNVNATWTSGTSTMAVTDYAY